MVWLMTANAVSVLSWASSRGLAGLRRDVAEYIASRFDAFSTVALDLGADDQALVLQCMHCRLRANECAAAI